MKFRVPRKIKKMMMKSKWTDGKRDLTPWTNQEDYRNARLGNLSSTLWKSLPISL